MQELERIPGVPMRVDQNWRYYLLDTVFALVGSLIITAAIYVSHLYPLIPNISIIYLLLIILLATTRGRYSAILAAIISAIAFDFFLVPPFFSFTIAQPTEWIALFVFLLIAIITSQLAGAARRRAEEVRLREHRLRILYELMRVSNSTESLDNQLDVIALSTTRVFSSWGVHTCALLLPDKDGTLVVKADAPIRVDALELTPEVLKAAAAVLQRGVMLTPSDASSQSVVHLFPLKVGTRVIAVLYLNVRDGVSWLVGEKALQAETARDSEQIEFFWTFLDQISSLIERALLRTQTFSHNN